jgi:hypothetical protein
MNGCDVQQFRNSRSNVNLVSRVWNDLIGRRTPADHQQHDPAASFAIIAMIPESPVGVIVPAMIVCHEKRRIARIIVAIRFNLLPQLVYQQVCMCDGRKVVGPVA